MTLAISDLTLAKSITDLNPCQSRQVIGGIFGINITKINVTTHQQIVNNLGGINYTAGRDINYHQVIPG